MSDLAQLRDNLAKSYNDVIYESFPFYFTHPTQLFTLAKLFHTNPTPVEKARVLELGCAAGGNLIPMAYHFPTAEFVGVDLAEKQIEIGLKQVADLSLDNLTLRRESILDFPESAGKFDYIVCHGVFSWVDKEVQHKILQIAQDHLTPNGVSYISYNTLPGWNMAKSVRELMQWHTKAIQDPAQKVQQARAVLKFLADGLKDDKSPYAQFLQSEIQLLSRQSDHYLLHEHLEHFNEPMYFHQFMEMVNEHKLSYLCDTNLALMYRENLVPAFAKELSKVNDSVVLGQYMDFMRNQRFRCTLLTHQTNQINRKIEANDIENFYLQLSAQCNVQDFSETTVNSETPVGFSSGTLTYTVNNTLSKLTMLILFENRGKPLHYKELCDALMKRGNVNNLSVIKQHLNNELNLMRLVFAGILQLTSYKPDYLVDFDEKPTVCPLARYLAQNGRHVANRRHQPIVLDPLSKLLIPHLDGSLDLKGIVEMVTQYVNEGKLSVLDPNKQLVVEPEKRADLIEINCKAFLQNLKQQALLVPENTTRQDVMLPLVEEEMVH